MFLPWSIEFDSNLFVNRMNYYLTGFFRFIQGICAGCAFPSSHGILSNWCPNSERGRIGGFIYTGLYAGPILGFSFGGIFTECFGHYSIYYGSALFGLIWSLTYYLLIYEHPNEHPTISDDEFKFIQQSLTDFLCINHDKHNENRQIPWKSIVTSLPVWSIAVAHFARGWTFYLLLTNQPTFLNVLGFGGTQNGLIGSFPHLIKVLVALSSGFLADFMRLNLSWSTTNIRKLMTSTGYFIEGTCLLLMSFCSNRIIGICLLTIGVGSSGLIVSGWHINHQDLSPRYASVIAGLTAVVGTSAGILSPIVAGILTRQQDLTGWRHVFIIVCLVLYVSSLFYLLFASGDLQVWSNGQLNQEKIRLNSDKLPPLLNSVEHQIQDGLERNSIGKTRFYSSISREQ